METTKRTTEIASELSTIYRANENGSIMPVYINIDNDPINKDNALFNYNEFIDTAKLLSNNTAFSLEPFKDLMANSIEFISSDITTFGFINRTMIYTRNKSSNLISDSSKWDDMIVNVISSNEWKQLFDHYNAFESCIRYGQINLTDTNIYDFIIVNERSIKISAVLRLYQNIAEILFGFGVRLPSNFQIKPITPWYDII